ncbi:class II aaRS and biotin synthetase [Delitschia confertaspora ATCC 74209]|uniref:threonine--tRNA ligase n=1 Tax=Delitschia confertaspora ATCC 74209 TaxID=1513339 RepID=A0A9P4MUR6_9PLEO|nr:class II aaRS and biotin synthetase [Delitschia confertaspora ATCC 74209]
MPASRLPLAVLNNLRHAQLSRRYALLYGKTFNRSCGSCTAPPSSVNSSSKNAALNPTTSDPPIPVADHRALAQAQNLFITSPYSPGSPLLQPNGAHIFQKLQSFLRAQYPQFGFQEVITPTIYKKSLWQVSGHWDEYAEHMFSVTGRGATGQTSNAEAGQDEEFGLKPMNCPGHCLLFDSTVRSYRDLPIRYADFSALHRNEVSGSLSGLTRVRRFHQDDAHIFCRPDQIQEEIMQTLKFVGMVYDTFNLGPYKLLLSTRPEHHFIGTISEWETAENQLKSALNASGREWSLNAGDGAFYGPKIDIILKDSTGKEHQTATIQLDFQLPQRFNLQYQASPEELETQETAEKDGRNKGVDEGNLRPVIIHRAIYGSLERFMALLIEHYAGSYPFWISPRQAVILALNQTPDVLAHVDKVQKLLSLGAPPLVDGKEVAREKTTPLSLDTIALNIDADTSARPLGKKIKEAREKGYNFIIVVGKEEVERDGVRIQAGSQDAETLFSVFSDTGSEVEVGMGGKKGLAMATGTAREGLEELVRRYL